MKLSTQARFELRVWMAENSRQEFDLQYIYDEIKDWNIDDINLYKKIAMGLPSFGEGSRFTKPEHETIIKKMNFVKNGDKPRLKDFN